MSDASCSHAPPAFLNPFIWIINQSDNEITLAVTPRPESYASLGDRPFSVATLKPHGADHNRDKTLTFVQAGELWEVWVYNPQTNEPTARLLGGGPAPTCQTDS